MRTRFLSMAVGTGVRSHLPTCFEGRIGISAGTQGRHTSRNLPCIDHGRQQRDWRYPTFA